jgi:hypothetical protein
VGREIVYQGHSNSIDCILKANNTAVDLSGYTQMTLSFGTVLISSTNNATHHILWNQAGYEIGEVRLYLGTDTQISPGSYDAPLVVYNATATAGIVWGKIGVIVKDDVEAA